jgi:hypothetical protein
VAGTHVERDTRRSAEQALQCENVNRREVRHMNMVPNRRAVPGRIVGAVDLDVGTLSQRCLYRYSQPYTSQA